MTCRHTKNDPRCSSHEDYVDPYPRTTTTNKAESLSSSTPDSSNYAIEQAEQVGPHLVMQVKYPNCSNCSYEGEKVMVFLYTTSLQALAWKKIDPHFRDLSMLHNASKYEAPSPAARFPGNQDGWCDAIVYARGKGK